MTLAVYLLGGDSREVDTEDVAVRAHELAPGRFTWRKYPDQINIELIRAFLSDAKKPPRGYLTGSGTTGWLLTEAGLRFAEANVARVRVPAEPTERFAPGERRRREHEYARIVASDALLKFGAGRTCEITPQEADAVFRLNPYILGRARALKVQKLVNAWGQDPALGAALHELARIALGASGS